MLETQNTRAVFQPLPSDKNGSVTWIHLGDLHMKSAADRNAIDLGRIVDAVNACFAQGGVSFVYLPGDIADDGNAEAYRVVRSHLDRLALPWCGIVGDHDVHGQSFEAFRSYIAEELTGAFTVGRYRFLRLNAFAEPRPDAFIVDAAQLAWVEDELRACERSDMRAVLLLHCYPSDLKQGGAELTRLIRRYPVLLVDMGHTHYNELSNDGRVLYSATRSTGQIEEGEAGFSVVTLDGDTVSWHFVQPDAPELVAITTPADRRLAVERYRRERSAALPVHAKVWSREGVARVNATLHGKAIELRNDAGVLWSGTFDASDVPDGRHWLKVQAVTSSGRVLSSHVEWTAGPPESAVYAPVDQDNAVGAWPERGILGTQLGPNKNGRQW